MISPFVSSEDLEIQKSPLNFTPYERFMYALNSNESKRQYPKRLQVFLDVVNIRLLCQPVCYHIMDRN